VFHIGDIVEAQVSFIVIPVKGGRHKMLMVLRLLALIKETLKKVSVQPTGPCMQLIRNEADSNTSRNSEVSEGQSDID